MTAVCQRKGLEKDTSDYMAASSGDFIMNLAELNVFLKASALLMKSELVRRCHPRAQPSALSRRGKVARVTARAEKPASK